MSTKKEIITEVESIRELIKNDDLMNCAKLVGKIDARLELLLEKIAGYGISEGRKEGINKAREARTAKTKEKVQNAINLLRIEGKEITAYQVAKVADISFNTAKKYLESINQKAPAV